MRLRRRQIIDVGKGLALGSLALMIIGGVASLRAQGGELAERPSQMHFTGELSLGSILTVATLIGIAVGLGRRIGGFESLMSEHAKTLDRHAERLDRYEGRIVDIVEKLGTVLGRASRGDHQ